MLSRQVEGWNFIGRASDTMVLVADPECPRCHGQKLPPNQFCNCIEFRALPADWDLLEVIEECKETAN